MIRVPQSLGKLLKSWAPMKILSQGKKMNINNCLTPSLKDSDLEEHFIKGHGPGGSRVNKKSNCVYLVHKPTGINVKVHEARELHINRKLARSKLLSKLDNFENGEMSIENQLKRIAFEKFRKSAQKQRKIQEMKNKWKSSLETVNKLN